MSWLARSFVNSLKVEDDSEEDDEHEHEHEIETRRTRESKNIDEDEDDDDHERFQNESTTEIPGRGVKEDLSELTKTLTRQLWGVASFLAPPPSSEPSSPSQPQPPRNSDPSTSDWNRWDSTDRSVAEGVSDPEISAESGRIAGIRSDFAEIGGKFKTGISKLSSHKAVSEISKIASSFLAIGSDENSDEGLSLIGDAVGVTDEVVVFARNIAMHPETWLDFPLADLEDSDDFDMSDVQQEHALAVERLAPTLAALRIELCPGHMSEGCFWKIYFVLLHSRLNKHDAELLSTPQIVEARAMLMQDLPGQTKREPDQSGIDTCASKETAESLHQSGHPSVSCNVPDETTELKVFGLEPKSSMETTDIETDKNPISSREIQIKSSVETADIETEKHSTESREVEIIDKVVVEEPVVPNEKKESLSNNSKKLLHQTDEEDADDWLAENTDMDDFTGTSIPIGNEDDVTFSDLEEDEDDDGKVMSSPQTVTHGSDSSSGKDPRDWVQLGKSSDDSSDDGKVSSRRADKPESKVTGDWLNVNEQHCESPM